MTPARENLRSIVPAAIALLTLPGSLTHAAPGPAGPGGVRRTHLTRPVQNPSARNTPLRAVGIGLSGNGVNPSTVGPKQEDPVQPRPEAPSALTRPAGGTHVEGTPPVRRGPDSAFMT